MGYTIKNHYAWYHPFQAVLESVVFLNWHSSYDDQVESQSRLNLHYVLENTLDMLTTGQYVYFQ